MLFRGVNITMPSGKLGDAVFATNRGTEYVRSLGPSPGSPTTEQQEIRDAVAAAVSNWKANPESRRVSWENWARAQLRTNTVCQRAPRTGFNEFVRWAVPRLQAITRFAVSLTTNPDDAPAPAEEPSDPNAAIKIRVDEQVYLNFTDGADWTTDPEAVALYYISAPIPPTRNRAYGGYNLLGIVQGNAAPPVSNTVICSLPSIPSSGDRIYYKIRISSPVHGMSEPTYGRIVYP